MHWLRTGNLLDLIAWLVLTGMWWVGGWLIVTHIFSLRRTERLIAGLASGVLLFIVLTNLIGLLLPLPAAFWAASGIISALGLVSKLRSPDRKWIDVAEFRCWPQTLAFFSLTVIFALVNRGLAILDDYHILPLVSMIAAGDLPPHFYLDTSLRFAYHYGLHLFAAGMVRVGGFSPWGAYDLSKAVSLALAAILAWLWFRRVTRSDLAGYLGALLAIFGGGARWLLLLLPVPWLMRLSQGINLLGSARHSGSDLYTVLISAWEIEGGGPVQLPFAFVNGIFLPNVFAIGGSAALPYMTLFLLLILAKRKWQPLPGLIYGLILASLALTAEHIFGLILIGVALVLWFEGRRRRSLMNVVSAGWVLVPAAVLALTAGGVFTELSAQWISRVTGSRMGDSFGYAGFSLRWPPAFISAHLGSLTMSNPNHLLVAAVEMGPVLLLAPWVTWWAWNRKRRGNRVLSALGLAAVFGFLLPLMLQYVDRDRDISRLTGAALYIWLLLGFPLAWFAFRKAGSGLRSFLIGGFSIAILSGVLLFSTMLVAIPRPQFSYFIQTPDAMFNRFYWNELAQDAQVLDPVPSRAITLFGRGGGTAASDIYTYLPEWEVLWDDPDPNQMARAGYAYLYFDKSWWRDIAPEQRAHFDAACVKMVAEQSMPDKDFRRLLDIRECK